MEKTKLNNTQEEVIIHILTDHILWQRVYKAMNIALNAVHPGANEYFNFDPNDQYTGYGSVLKLIGLVEVSYELNSVLHEIFSEISKSDGDARLLANRLYLEWSAKIDEYKTRKSTSLGRACETLPLNN